MRLYRKHFGNCILSDRKQNKLNKITDPTQRHELNQKKHCKCYKILSHINLILMECNKQSFDKKVHFVIVVTCLYNLHDSQRLMPVICIFENEEDQTRSSGYGCLTPHSSWGGRCHFSDNSNIKFIVYECLTPVDPVVVVQCLRFLSGFS